MPEPGTRPAMDGCIFCEARNLPSADLPWYRRPMWPATDCAVVLPGLGSLTSVYVQVGTGQHLVAASQLDAPAAVGFAAVLAFVAREVAAACGGVTLFEHGGTTDTARRQSACIDHAHLHVLAGEHPLGEWLQPQWSYDSLETFLLEHNGNEPYLMYSAGVGRALVAPDIGQSQYFRRIIAARLGIADEWDWALFPHWERVRTTIEFLGDLSWPPMASVMS